MYLSRLNFNLRSRQARFDLADRYELHRTVMSAFAETLDEHERVLYRVETQQSRPVVPVLVQSQGIPNWAAVTRMHQNRYLAKPPEVRQVLLHHEEREMLPFRLQANPTVKRDNKRHAIFAEEALLSWLTRKGDANGFQVDPAHLKIVKLGYFHGKKQQQTWHGVQFDGVLTVIRRDAFQRAIINGIGSAKAFGFGLLSVPYGAA